MTYEELRISCQSDEQMARALFAEVVRLQDELDLARATMQAAVALHSLEQGLRTRAEKKLAAALAPRRSYRLNGEQ